MCQPWLTTTDWPVNAAEGNAASVTARRGTSTALTKAVTIVIHKAVNVLIWLLPAICHLDIGHRGLRRP